MKRDKIGQLVLFPSSNFEPEWLFRTPKQSFGIATERSWMLGGTEVTSCV